MNLRPCMPRGCGNWILIHVEPQSRILWWWQMIIPRIWWEQWRRLFPRQVNSTISEFSPIEAHFYRPQKLVFKDSKEKHNVETWRLLKWSSLVGFWRILGTPDSKTALGCQIRCWQQRVIPELDEAKVIPRSRCPSNLDGDLSGVNVVKYIANFIKWR